MKVYVASSWRNERQPEVVEALRAAGHEVYDFRNPPNGAGFGWEQITERKWELSMPVHLIEALNHERAEEGFNADFDALQACDAVVMVQPCGVSAALELGWAVGAQKFTSVLLAPNVEPELMLKMAGQLCQSLPEVIENLAALEAGAAEDWA